MKQTFTPIIFALLTLTLLASCGTNNASKPAATGNLYLVEKLSFDNTNDSIIGVQAYIDGVLTYSTRSKIEWTEYSHNVIHLLDWHQYKADKLDQTKTYTIPEITDGPADTIRLVQTTKYTYSADKRTQTVQDYDASDGTLLTSTEVTCNNSGLSLTTHTKVYEFDPPWQAESHFNYDDGLLVNDSSIIGGQYTNETRKYFRNTNGLIDSIRHFYESGPDKIEHFTYRTDTIISTTYNSNYGILSKSTFAAYGEADPNAFHKAKPRSEPESAHGYHMVEFVTYDVLAQPEFTLKADWLGSAPKDK